MLTALPWFYTWITITIFLDFSARERIVGWYHTGPKLHKNDIAINELIKQYCTNSVCKYFTLFLCLTCMCHDITLLYLSSFWCWITHTCVALLSDQVLVIIDVKPKDLGLPTEAYISVEEIHDVSWSWIATKRLFLKLLGLNNFFKFNYKLLNENISIFVGFVRIDAGFDLEDL